MKRTDGSYYSLSWGSLPGATALRMACVVSKKVFPNAVDRARERRRCRAALAEHISKVHEPLALVVRIRKSAGDAPFQALRHDVKVLFEKAGLIGKS